MPTKNPVTSKIREIEKNYSRYCVYFVQGELTKLVKIGKTNNLVDRLSQHRQGSPDILNLVVAIFVATDSEAIELEHKFHVDFYKQREHGEWYNIDHATIADLAKNYPWGVYFA